jgi:hypothetical protein
MKTLLLSKGYNSRTIAELREFPARLALAGKHRASKSIEKSEKSRERAKDV